MPKDASALHGHQLHPAIEACTVGEDFRLDRALVAYDCAGSIAHAMMLRKTGVRTVGKMAYELPDGTLKRLLAIPLKWARAAHTDCEVSRWNIHSFSPIRRS